MFFSTSMKKKNLGNMPMGDMPMGDMPMGDMPMGDKWTGWMHPPAINTNTDKTFSIGTGAKLNETSLNAENKTKGEIKDQLVKDLKKATPLQDDWLKKEISFVDNMFSRGEVHFFKAIEEKDDSFCQKIDANTYPDEYATCKGFVKWNQLDYPFLDEAGKVWPEGAKFDLEGMREFVKVLTSEKKNCWEIWDVVKYMTCKKYFDKNFSAQDFGDKFRKIYWKWINYSAALENLDTVMETLGLEKDSEKCLKFTIISMIQTLQKK